MKKDIIPYLIFYAFIIFVVYRICKLDNHDRTHPYGLDHKRNARFPNKKGEKYGVGVFWGKPNSFDDIKSHLNKIDWLSTSYERDVEWRRCISISLVMSMALWLVIDPFILKNTKTFFTTFIIIFIFTYLHIQYWKHHINHRRGVYIKDHVLTLKEKLNIPAYNPIYKHFI
jgi:hypothetical protein